ncbi:MAG: hypothetical protein ACP5K1_05585 [Candidatus Bathyarchaeia archaeon]
MQPSEYRIGLKDLIKPGFGKIICYPNPSIEELEKRVEELRSLKVSGIILEGRVLVDGLPILGKGCTSTVVKAMAGGRLYALKARRTDSDRASMDSEAQLQIQANSISIGARLKGFTRNFILMELLHGPLISEWIDRRPALDELKAVLAMMLRDCFKMDIKHLDHGELTNASRHIIIERGVPEGRSSGDGAALKPVFIDFESASMKRRSKNVTSICQFLFLSNEKIKALLANGIDDAELMGALKAYKAQPSRETFNSILRSTGLLVGQ